MFRKRLLFIEKVLALATVFLIPTQLALHFWPSYAFVFGLRVDYLSPVIYLTDILVFSILGLWVLQDSKTLLMFVRKHAILLFLILLFVLFNTIFSTSIWVTMFRWVKIFEIFLFGLYIYLRKNLIGNKHLVRSLFASAVFFSAIGIVQFFLGRTTGLLYLIGERTFNITTPGIALVSINGQNFLRAYSTFPHPNALAGFLGASIILILGTDLLKKTLWFYTGVLVIALGLLLSFSLSAFLALIFICLLSLRRITVKTIFSISLLGSLSLPFVSVWNLPVFSKNISERLNLSFLAGKMIADKFLTGVGLNTFIVNIPKFNNGLMTTWLLQPVHNIFLLVIAETGVLGLLLFSWGIFVTLKFLFRNKNKTFVAIFVFILLTGLTDHYWLTIQQNLLFLSFFLGLSAVNYFHER